MYKRGKNLKLLDEKSIFIGENVIIGDDVTIYENNRIEGNTVIGDGCILLPGNYIKDTEIGSEATFNASQSENSSVGERTYVGPYARLRPGSVIGKDAKIGNFVEIKNSTLGDGTKVSHLAYVGDCDIGRNCNIGCGAIFVNYSGKEKKRTKVGDNCFIGSNCNVIAPVTVEKNSYICAGTTVHDDIKEDSFVIGRARQTVKENRAHNYLKEMY